MDAQPLNVLLVEDSPTDALLLQESLSHARPGQFNFTHVECWGEAEERLALQPFDAMLLDLTLPDITGRETFLRARADAPNLPIVVLTAEANEAMGLEAVRHGIQDYLIKGQTYGRQTVRSIRFAIERKQVEDALRQTQEALRETNAQLEKRVAERTASLAEIVRDLDDFSHSITHDLRAPLRAIRAFAQILQDECLMCARPNAQDHLHRIIAAAARMDKLIQDVLQYSRMARTELNLVPVDCKVLLRSIIETYPNLKPYQQDIHLQKTLPRVLGSEAALTTCFSNLLGNAVKFVAPGVRPQVHIWAERLEKPRAVGRKPRATRALAAEPAAAPKAPLAPQLADAAFVRLWFADNGVGIPEEVQDRLFKLFQRLNKSYEGTGVGLAVVHKAVEKMGGKVGLESKPGKGSRFWLDLPLAPRRERAKVRVQA